MSAIDFHPACLPWLKNGDRVLAGLSGGRDSVALLLLLHRVGVPVCACHVHHGIRGGEADRDARFSRELAVSLGIPCDEVRIDAPALAGQWKMSLEAAARRGRHAALEECALSRGCKAVALAHHQDDQAETILFRLCRGAAGPKGIRPVREGRHGLVWLRPLLHLSRKEITDWLRSIGQEWCDDSTNGAPCCARNILRREALPALDRALGRRVAPILARSARLAGETAAALDEALAALELIDPQGRLYLPKILAFPHALQKAALHWYLRLCRVPGVTEEGVRALLGIIAPRGPARCMLCGAVTARRRERRLWVEDAAGQLLLPGRGREK